MKRKITMITSILLICILVLGTSVTAYAKTVYYPSNGNANGYCENQIRSSVCTYNNLPVNLKVSYFMESNRVMEIRFYTNSNLTGGYTTVQLPNDTDGREVSVTLPYAGKYYVVVQSRNNLAATFTYAYNLYHP